MRVQFLLGGVVPRVSGLHSPFVAHERPVGCLLLLSLSSLLPSLLHLSLPSLSPLLPPVSVTSSCLCPALSPSLTLRLSLPSSVFLSVFLLLCSASVSEVPVMWVG